MGHCGVSVSELRPDEGDQGTSSRHLNVPYISIGLVSIAYSKCIAIAPTTMWVSLTLARPRLTRTFFCQALSYASAVAPSSFFS